ncbi:hypothetical protein BS50DRAFT_644661 [Corynespora cassiicola Philippines]|uniref:Potassium transport protein n=1 Tax=Corynespora cassiicola Philippines TaxID=1448308 RepID=A0A2T2NHJ5_CORCC|nr:hypothetical protein BS50DRAFT_644661 [Corynespora cassiicola Philippines]
MWRPPINFLTLHYAYIVILGVLGLIVIYPYGNLTSIDAYFFGVSASTESGLNPVDVKALKTYQQLVIYFIPTLGNLGFINIIVVIVRIHFFEKRLKDIGPSLLRSGPRTVAENDSEDLEANIDGRNYSTAAGTGFMFNNPCKDIICDENANLDHPRGQSGNSVLNRSTDDRAEDMEVMKRTASSEYGNNEKPVHITFDNASHPKREPKALYIPSIRERDQGQVQSTNMMIDDEITIAPAHGIGSDELRRRRFDGHSISEAISVERIASSMFVIGATPSQSKARSQRPSPSHHSEMPRLSSQVTIGRNSMFQNLTKEDRELLGGLEYRALKLLLKIVIGYFLGLHLLGIIVLVGWIHSTSNRYTEYLASQGQNVTWWGFYSAQTMVNNLGFTLTPDSMISFQDAQWPMVFMSFLAYAGNTCYPCLLRFIIWVIYRITPTNSLIKEPLDFLLKHPRRCYTLLFPSRPTWILFGILFALNFVDIVLIIVLDLDNPAVNKLAAGPRIAASIFQAASARHTGTASFNLAEVHPAVQFSLLVMMYISVFPIAIAVRASNTYEEKSLGIYMPDADIEEGRGTSYVLRHMQNQLSFDLWYIFLGIFCIAIAEADKIVDDSDPAFAIFPIFFEVVSAYGNVGLSLGHPSNLTSLCGHFTPFSKLVICAMMIRGRHRGLPYQLDRAIVLPSSKQVNWDETEVLEGPKMKRFHTQ